MNEKYFINVPNNSLCDNLTTQLLKNHNSTEFHKTLSDYEPTPLVHLPNLSKKYSVGNIFVKDESHRFNLSAYKVLGSSYAIHKSLEKDPSTKTFCAATDGNHGRAVAWAAKHFERKSVIFVPKHTSIARIEAIEGEGAEVIKVNGNYDLACDEAFRMCSLPTWKLIQDTTSWEDYIEIPALIMSGYLTMFKELEDSVHTIQKAKIDIVFLQAGVGSMAASGIFYYLNRYGVNRPKIVIVEPEEADGILYSFKNDTISTSLGNCQTIMAGLNCETPSLCAWEILKSGTDVSIKIKDEYAKQAIRELYFPNGTDERVISGDSGIGGLAGFLAIVHENDLRPVKQFLNIGKHTNILFINTEGCTDKPLFQNIINNDS